VLRRLLLSAILATALPAVASAQPAPSDGLLATPPAAEPAPGATSMPWAQDPEPGSHMRKPEVRSGRPSGFWTSTRPAKGGAYRWRILGVGAAVLAVTVFFVVRLLRRASTAPRPAR